MTVDKINSPKHYTVGSIEVIDFLEDQELNFHRATAVKYITRAGIKDPETEIEDLQKALWYIDREVKRILKKKGDPNAGSNDSTKGKPIFGRK